MSIRLTIICILALAFGFCATADAQTVQPTYTRPSKGAALQILNSAVTFAPSTYAPSAIFDWTAFAGVIVTVNAPAADCRYGVRVKALGGTSTNKSDFFLLNVANNDYKANNSQAWYVRVLPGYLYFQMESYDAGSSLTACTGNFKVTITPLPIDYAGQLVSTGVRNLFWEGGDIVLDSTLPYTRLQNYDTAAARCAVKINGAYDYARPAFVLKADSTGTAGDGGVIEINNWVGAVNCIGSTSIIGFAH